MSPPPLVSIVVPTFNRARLLPAAINSALQQTWQQLEVLVVDDGSVDDTPDVVSDLYRRDERVRYFRQQNQGVSVARNRALAEARGGYVAFLDSDDVWRPWKLQLQMQLFASQPALAMCWTDMEAVDGAGCLLHTTYLRQMYSAYRRLSAGHPFANWSRLGDLLPRAPAELHSARCGLGDIYTPMLYGNLVHTSTVVLRREVAQHIGGFDESMRRGGEDFKFHLATCRHGAVALLDVPSIQYRVGEDDRITHPRNNAHFARSFLRTVQEELREFRPRIGLTNAQVRSILSEAHEWLAESGLDEHRRGSAAGHALQAMWHARAPRAGLRPLVKSLLPWSLLTAIQRWKACRRTTAIAPNAALAMVEPAR